METFKMDQANAAENTLTNILKQFDDNLTRKKNFNAVERYKLFTHKQNGSETMDQYISP